MNSKDLILEQEMMIERCDRLLARIAPHPTIRAFLTLLGDQTHRHASTLGRAHRQCFAELNSNRVFATGMMLLRRLERVADRLQLNPSHLQSYESLCEVVQQNEQLYHDLAKQSRSPRRTAMYRQLGCEEHIHFVLLRDFCRTLGRCLTGRMAGREAQAVTV